ncbi:MAG: hypothetical protein JXR19_05180 [Bacteroidia bacterium]
MKYLAIIISLSFFACSNEPPPPVNLLVGDWIRTNNDVGELTTEHWLKTDSTFEGSGYTYKEDSLVFSEHMVITKEGEEYFLTVYGVNDEPTPFKFYNWTSQSFTCINQENDFPKTFTYSFTKDKMKAVIGDGVRSVNFDFVRIEP